MARATGVGSGRAAFEHRAWATAYERLSAADRELPLPVADLERSAVAAYLCGRDEAGAAAWERAHREYLDADDAVSAARCAFWLGLELALRGEEGRAGGWLVRARRLLDDGGVGLRGAGIPGHAGRGCSAWPRAIRRRRTRRSARGRRDRHPVRRSGPDRAGPAGRP